MMEDKVRLDIKILRNFEGLSLPTRMTKGSAGMDLCAAIEEDIIMIPMVVYSIPTGIAIGLPECYEAQIRPRSGLATKHNITIINAPGTIDSDYHGEIFIPLINLGQKEYVISRGMRIAQMVIARYSISEWNIVSEFTETERNTSGFGSTGY